MFHRIVTLTIGITLYWIAHETTAGECPENEVLTMLVPENQPSCGNKNVSDKWTIGKRCVCTHQWFVRNEAGECIPVWKCPDVCPPNEEFERCTDNDQQLIATDEFTAEEVLHLCEPVCSCKQGYARGTKKGKCVWAPFRDKFIGIRG